MRLSNHNYLPCWKSYPRYTNTPAGLRPRAGRNTVIGARPFRIIGIRVKSLKQQPPNDNTRAAVVNRSVARPVKLT
jgi:hypothetical protein